MIAFRSIPVLLLAALMMGDATGVAEIAAPDRAPDAVFRPPIEAPRLVPGGLSRSLIIIPMPFPVVAPRRGFDVVAQAVEGAESSYGRDPAMWRADPRGPQGPMQVSEAAAIDVGGGNRFDINENRFLGRAYLGRMYTRYGNWQDALLAYNWGPGNLDQWIDAGRPADRLNTDLSRYVTRVLSESLSPDDPFNLEPAPPAAELPTTSGSQKSTTPTPLVHEETISDPRLRKMVAGNNRMLAQLRTLLDAMTPQDGDGALAESSLSWLTSKGIEPAKLAAADAEAVRRLREAGARLVLAISTEISHYPGDENFRPMRSAQRTLDMDQIRLFAGLLMSKLQEENSVLALVDMHKRAEIARKSPTSVE